MPPTFPYFLALGFYVTAAFAVWGFCVILAFIPSSRYLAKRVALGMFCSFPGVFSFQLLVAPIVAVVLLLFGVLIHLLSPSGSWEAACFVALALVCFLLVAAASCLGFWVGWRVGWEFASGRSVRTYLRSVVVHALPFGMGARFGTRI
jgi:hypothetical protein